MAPPLQLAQTTWKPENHDTHQPPPVTQAQPVDAPQLDGSVPISGFSKAKRAVDAKAAEIADRFATVGNQDIQPVNAWRLHDLRRTCGTGMARLGIESVTISRVLNYAEGGVTKIYNRYSYLNEKRQALDAWAAHIGQLVEGEIRPLRIAAE